MGEKLIIIDNKNKDKTMALQQAILAKGVGYRKKEYQLKNRVDVRHLRKQEAIDAATQQAIELFNQSAGESWFNPETTVTLVIQKGTSILDLDDDPELFCVVAVYVPVLGKVITKVSEQKVPLKNEVRYLVHDQKMDLYDAYGKVYGPKVKNKQTSLYELFFREPEVDWIAQTIKETLDDF